MIKEETAAFLVDRKEQQALSFHETIIERAGGFLREQADDRLSTAQSSVVEVDKIDALFGRQSLQERDVDLRAAHKQLDQYAL